MKGRGRKLRLSPNEEARIIREEKERRRKLRLVQVREQAKANAAKVRKAVKDERYNQICLLASEIKDEWEKEKAEKVRKLEELHLRSLRHVGDAHVNATEQEPRDVERALVEQQNLQRATQRHLDALKKMKEEKRKREEEETRHIVARQAALEEERERAAVIAALPPPERDPIEEIEPLKVKPIKLTDVNAFSLTHYHLPPEEVAVERAQPAEQEDAKAAAQEEQERLDILEEAERVAALERHEKAQLRHRHARQQQMLQQDYDAMLLDLSDMRRADVARRQQVVAKIPRSVYQAPHRRLEEKEEEQRVMEAAFEDMYMAATDFQGNLSLALDRHPPLAATPEGSSALDLSLDTERDVSIGKKPAGLQGLPLKDLTNLGSQRLQQMAAGKASDSALSRLMGKIHAQREAWASKTPGAVDTRDLRSSPALQPSSLEKAKAGSDVGSTSTGESLTQYSLTPTEQTHGSRAPSSLEESSLDASTVSTLTGSKVSSLTSRATSLSSATTRTGMSSSDMTSSTADTLEEGTVSSTITSGQTSLQDMDTLLHPMEIASKIRQKPLVDGSNGLTSFLDVGKSPKEVGLQNLVQDFRREQQRLEKERSALEKKIQRLENQAGEKPGLPATGSFATGPVAAMHGPSSVSRQTSQEADWSAATRPDAASTIDKVKLYQQRALQRYKARQQGKDLTGSSLSKSLNSVTTDNSLVNGLSGLSQFEDVSLSRTSSDVLSPAAHAVIASATKQGASDTSSVQQLTGDHLSRLHPAVFPPSAADESLQSRTYSNSDFDARQAALREQLADIQRQKAEILNRQKRHHEEMVELKQRWQNEIEHYSRMDSALANRSLSRSLDGRLSSLGDMSVSTDPLASSWSHPVPAETMEEDDPEAEQLLQHLNDLPLKATDHKYKIHKRRSVAKVIKVPNKSPMMPHELSTIQEMDTPATERKQKESQPAMPPLSSLEAGHTDRLGGRSVARNLFAEEVPPKTGLTPVAELSDSMGSSLHSSTAGLDGYLRSPSDDTLYKRAPYDSSMKSETPSLPSHRETPQHHFDTSFEANFKAPSLSSRGIPIYSNGTVPVEPPPFIDALSGLRPVPTSQGSMASTSGLLDNLPRLRPTPLPTANEKEHESNNMWSRYNVGIASKLDPRSIDHVQEKEWPPRETPGEVMIDTLMPSPPSPPPPSFLPRSPSPPPPPPPAQEVQEIHPVPKPEPGKLPTEGTAENDEYHPTSNGITISTGDMRMRRDEVDRTEQETHNAQSVPPAGLSRPPEEKKPPVHPTKTERQRAASPPPATPTTPASPSAPRTPKSVKTPTDSPPKFEFHSLYVPLKSQQKDSTWKQKLAEYNLSYLTPPKTSPGRSTDKIVRCITTRGFGCERPIKKGGRKGQDSPGQSGQDPAESGQTPPGRKVPPPTPPKPKRPVQGKETPDGPSPATQNTKPKDVMSPEEDFTPSRIRELFERSRSNRSKRANNTQPFQVPSEASPIPKDHAGASGFDEHQGQFLASTPSSTKASSRVNHREQADNQTGVNGIGRTSAGRERTGRKDETETSALSQFTLSHGSTTRGTSLGGEETPGWERSGAGSALSQHRLDSESSSVRTPASLGGSSLEQGSLSLTGTRSGGELSLTQLPLGESSIKTPTGGPADGNGATAAGFQPLMEYSRSSQGSAASKSTTSSQQASTVVGVLEKADSGSRGSWRSSYSQEPQQTTGVQGGQSTVTAGQEESSQSAAELALDISKRAEAAMEKYDRLVEESRQLRRQYQQEEQSLITEAGAGPTSTRRSSLGMAVAEETGISDEPDLTLVSISSTPQKEPSRTDAVETKVDDPSTGGSLKSFEEHEQSLATLSQVSFFHPSLSGSDHLKASVSSTPWASASSATELDPASLAHDSGSSASSLGQGSSAEQASHAVKQGAKGSATSMVSENKKHMSQTLASWKKNNALQSQSSKPAEAAAAEFMTTKSTDDLKKKEREMKERTERLYSQLEDVKKERQERERQEEYATNRQRKQEYQKKYQEQLKKKIQSKKN